MKIKVVKIIIMLLAFLVAFSNLTVWALPAASPEMVLLDEGAGGGGESSTGLSVTDAFKGDTGDVENAVTATQKVIGMILDIIRIIGMGIAIIMLTYIGIKFMLASPSERANIKQYSINFVIGAFILIGGTGILTIIKNFAVDI